jgi:uncharacterized protein YecE (DUF72 family)
MNAIYIGTSGYNYKDWKGKFYPDKLPQKQWLEFYSNNFNTLEINATFYRSFPKRVFENWFLKTPENFKFVIKGPRLITHYKKLLNIEDDLNMFLENCSGLKEKLAVLLWQFPASFKNIPDNLTKLKSFLKYLPLNINQVVELRDNSWFTTELTELLNQLGIGFVINDTSAFDKDELVTGKLAYVRFHGPTFLYASSYSDQELRLWAKKIKDYAKKLEVYVFFNNDVSGYAINNANTLKKYLEKD